MTQPLLLSAPGNPDADVFDGWSLELPNGLLLGSKDSTGVEWRLEDVSGWDTVASTSQVTQRAYANGGWANHAFQAPRYVTATGKIYHQSRILLRRATEQLEASVPLNELGMVTQHRDDVSRFIMARGDGEQFIQFLQADLAAFSLQLVAPDPRKLQAGLPQQRFTPLPTTSGGGLSLPFTVPFSIGATVSTGLIKVESEGNVDAKATIRIDGPVTNPTVTHLEQGKSLTFELVLNEGEWLDIDLDNRTVIISGQASRRNTMRGDWFTFPPGVSTLAFAAQSANPAAALSVTWRNAWK